MALNGVHVECGYVGNRTRQLGDVNLIGELIWSKTISASGGVTDRSVDEVKQSNGQLVLSVVSSADIFYAIGPTPNASADPRRFLAANTPIDVLVRSGDKFACVPA